MSKSEDQVAHRCGYVAIIGRPNVGKSTLLNHILGIKLSITSRKPQTTRHQILGIKSDEHVQTVYVDTPGLHQRRGSAINKYMNRAAASVMSDVDVLLFVIQALEWTDEDEAVLQRLETITVPVILVVNKTDQVNDKEALLPFISDISSKFKFHNVIPTAAVKGMNLDKVELLVTVTNGAGLVITTPYTITNVDVAIIGNGTNPTGTTIGATVGPNTEVQISYRVGQNGPAPAPNSLLGEAPGYYFVDLIFTLQKE